MKALPILSAIGVALVVFASTGALALAGPGDEERPERRAGAGVAGIVESKSGSDLIVKTRHYRGDAREVTVHVLPDTVCKTRGEDRPQEMDCDDIQVGNKVIIRGQRAGEGAINARVIGVATGAHERPKYRMWAGQIQSIEGNEVTVTNRGGNTYEIYLTPSTIVLPRDHGELQVGDRIAAFAQWNAEKSEYEALVVIVPPGRS